MPTELSVGIRPAEPDSCLLEQATIALQQRYGITLPFGWVVNNRMEKPTSTLMRITGEWQGNAVVVFYKALYVSPALGESHRLEFVRRHRTAMLRELEFSPQLRDQFVGQPFRFDEPLALDVQRLHGFRLGVPGRELGRGVAALLPPSRAAPRDLHALIGRGLRSLDVFGASQIVRSADQQEPRPANETVASRLRSDLEWSQPRMLAPAYESAARLVSQLEESEQGQRLLVLVHRDMSPSNILVDWPQLGFVDFTWEPDVRHRDLAQFLTRMSFARPYVRGWWTAVANSVMEGYDMGADEMLDWNVALLQRAIKSSWTARSKLQEWGAKTLMHFERSGLDGTVGFPLY